jgi:pyridoxal/pyridoxine/pyridoxamine kinase
MSPANKKRYVEALNQLEFPTLGDPSKVYPVELTEPEINTIHAVFGFVASNLAEVEMLSGVRPKFADHYIPTLRELSKRLGKFDD